MELLQLRYFKRVAELQHMTKAAEEFHIAQPSLSKTIRLLEDELGTELFDRKGKYIVLNDAGRIFKHYADTVVSAVDDARQEIEEYKATGNATVTISLRVAPIGFPDLIARFREQHPGVKFIVEQHQHYLDDLKKGRCDITVYSSMTKVSAPNELTILEEPILLAVPKEHPLAEREFVRLREIAGEDLIASSPAESNLRYAINTYCKIAGFQPKIVMDCDDYMTIQGFVRTGVGLAFIPKVSWLDQQAVPQDLHYIPIVEPECKRCINLHWKNTGYVSKASVLFRKFALEYFSKKADYLVPEERISVIKEN
ncbi:LysR family transcriptional regulator [Cuneatibacter sp. NSJ-177]|uniref:LysR family transcriptional regulator n=1 Tax=Cuneatibacter sp. NSJ-177 TaxID=2931401 RepID=UPI001FD3BE8D|nr:LysR family transcriptional regulator [Cuneatibacter sp. NSJ-177]MCJ7836245.1 LysR family transcriptional regulator [Cuneatibacter sp. NSJ-177]